MIYLSYTEGLCKKAMDEVDMFSSCVEWLDDWVTSDPPEQLYDAWDFEQWMESEMIEGMQVFLKHAFHKIETKTDAIEVLRSLLAEYFKMRSRVAVELLEPAPASVTRILALPQTPQKTVEWKQEAYNLLTGHEFAEVVYGSVLARQRVIAKKCIPPGPLTQEQSCVRTPEGGKITPFQWGWRFEPVVRQIFEATGAEGSIDDSLGRIRHPTLPRLAASPDGLITAGPKVGRLVEIKSPITRKLTYVVPQDYWCQMQLQAEVCDVEAVEYIEIRFGLGDPPTSYANKYVGVVSVVGTLEDPSTYTYVYSPLLNAHSEYAPPSTALEVCKWYILDQHTETVLRNRVWWKSVGQPAYETFWKDVELERLKPVEVKPSVCLIPDDE